MALQRITVEPGLYRGSFAFRGLTKTSDGDYPYWGPFSCAFGRVTCMLPEDRYELFVSHGAGYSIEIRGGTVDCGGSAGLKCAGNEIHFETVSIDIDPGQYLGSTLVVGIEPEAVHGARSIRVLPGIVGSDDKSGYILAFEHSNSIRFDVSADGNVGLSAHYRGAATTQANKLTLRTVSVLVDAGGYAGTWQLRGAESLPHHGSRDVVLVPHARGYILELAPGVNDRFDLSVDGSPIPGELKIPFQGTTWTFRLSRSN